MIGWVVPADTRGMPLRCAPFSFFVRQTELLMEWIRRAGASDGGLAIGRVEAACCAEGLFDVP